MDSGRFQRHNGSSLPRNTADREDRFILRSLSQRLIHLINHQTCNPHTSVHMTIYRRLMERNLLSHLPLRPLPLMPVHCRARLQWCLARSVQFQSQTFVHHEIQADDTAGPGWENSPLQQMILLALAGKIVHSNQSRTQEFFKAEGSGVESSPFSYHAPFDFVDFREQNTVKN
ncbi:hypothetical protein TNCV_1479331 [Trichonephila clavipes]|nr:hypothetical protein TNCV_1479331 [Trichonephila clavipes]